MGRIVFLSAVAFLAYKYISRSNKRHQALTPGAEGALEILPPTPSTAKVTAPLSRGLATESTPAVRVLATTSRAAESEPVR